MALAVARIAFAVIALMLIVPVVIASVLVACLVYPCAWLSGYKLEPPSDPRITPSDQESYDQNQLRLARVWEAEGR